MQILQIVDKQQFLTSFDISELLTIYKGTRVFCAEWKIYPYNYISELSELSDFRNVRLQKTFGFSQHCKTW